MVSIIIPNYNHSVFLKERIDSILNQTYQNFELIILDDCSTDDSKMVIETYRKHPSVQHIIYNKENSGSPFLQWKKGVTLTKGEFVWIAESDDFAEPDFLQKTVLQIEKNKKIGLVYCDSNIIQKNIITTTFKQKNSTYMNDVNWEKDYLIKGLNELERHLIRNCIIYNVSAVLFRKDALSAVIHKIIGFKYAGDWVAYMLIALSYNIYYISETLNNYRSHENNLTKKSGDNYFAMLERIKARHFIKLNLREENNYLSTKIRRLNLIELRAVIGGLIRGKISPIAFYNILKLYV